MTIIINPNVELQDGDHLRWNEDNQWFDPVPAVSIGNVRMQSSGEGGQIMVRGEGTHYVNPSEKTIADFSRRLLPFSAYAQITVQTTPYAVTIDRPISLLKWSQSYFVNAINNNDNYWRIQLQTNGGVLALFSTDASNEWKQAAITEFTPSSVNSNDKRVFVQCLKIGNPGVLYLAAPLLEVTY